MSREKKELRVKIPADLHDWLMSTFPHRGQPTRIATAALYATQSALSSSEEPELLIGQLLTRPEAFQIDTEVGLREEN